MFFVRFLLFFTALYISHLQADDFTKRIPGDHHNSKIDYVVSSPSSVSRLATLAIAHKEKASQLPENDELKSNNQERKKTLEKVLQNVHAIKFSDDEQIKRNESSDGRHILAASEAPFTILEYIINIAPKVGPKIIEVVGQVGLAIFAADLGKKAADTIQEKNQSSFSKDQQHKENCAKDHLRHVTNLKNAGVTARANALVTICDLPNGNQGVKISDQQCNEVIFEVKDGYASMVSEHVAHPGTYPNLLNYTTPKTEEQIYADNKRQEALEAAQAKSLKKYNTDIAQQKKDKEKADKKTRKNNQKALLKKANIDRNERIEKAQHEQNIKIQQAQEQLVNEAKRIENLLPSTFNAPRRDKHGNLPRTKDGAYIDGKGSTYKFNPTTNAWDVKNKFGKFIFQVKPTVSKDDKSFNSPTKVSHDQPKVQTSEANNSTIPASDKPAELAKKAAVYHPATFGKPAASKDLNLPKLPAENSHTQPKEKTSEVNNSATSMPAESVNKPAASKDLDLPKSCDQQKEKPLKVPSLGSGGGEGLPLIGSGVATVVQGAVDGVKKVGQGVKEGASTVGQGLTDTATKVGQGVKEGVSTVGSYVAPYAPIIAVVGAVVGVGYAGYKVVKYYNRSDEDKSQAPSKIVAPELEKPETKSCGGGIDTREPALTSPAPEIKDPHLGGCGKPAGVEKPNHTGHGPQPEIAQDLPGCGKPQPGLEDAHKQPGCGGMDRAAAKPETFKNSDDGKTRKIGDLSRVDVEFRDGNKTHIFDDRPGHIIDTPENRARIMNLVKDINNFGTKDRHGKLWFGKILPDGTQLWAHVINDVITNCGLNEVPIECNKESGYSRSDKPQQK